MVRRSSHSHALSACVTPCCLFSNAHRCIAEVADALTCNYVPIAGTGKTTGAYDVNTKLGITGLGVKAGIIDTGASCQTPDVNPKIFTRTCGFTMVLFVWKVAAAVTA